MTNLDLIKTIVNNGSIEQIAEWLMFVQGMTKTKYSHKYEMIKQLYVEWLDENAYKYRDTAIKDTQFCDFLSEVEK